MDTGGFGRAFNLLAGRARLAIGDVVFDRIIEQHGVLRHDTNGLPHTCLGDDFDVLPGNGDAALLDVIKPEQQPCKRGLSCAGRTHHRHGFTGRNFKTHILQNWPGGFIGKTDVFKAYGR